MNLTPRTLRTSRGEITFPAYVPVTTFGEKYPLDELVRPYLPRLAQAVMVSFHYAQHMREKPSIPVMIDSGGFAALFEDSQVVGRRGLGYLRTKVGSKAEATLSPRDVLEFQEQNADIAFTLDFPIPPNLSLREAKRRQKLTLANAEWAIANRRRKDLLLFGCIQAWDAKSAVSMAKTLAKFDFDGVAIGGLVPRARDRELMESIVQGVRNQIPESPLHVFGIGKPETTQWLFDLGVDSVDSSSYVKLAADGRLWGQAGTKLGSPATTDRLHIALCNLAVASRSTVSLAMQSLMTSTIAIKKASEMGQCESRPIKKSTCRP